MKRRDWFTSTAAGLGAFALGHPFGDGEALAGENIPRRGTEPGFIDVHVHVCKPRHPKVTRPNGSHYPAPQTLIEMMDAAGIDMAVVQAGVSPECRYTTVTPEEVLEICGLGGLREDHPAECEPAAEARPRCLLILSE